MEALRADVRTVLANQDTILQHQQSLQAQLAQLLAFHHPPPPPPPSQLPSDHQGSSLHPLLFFYCQRGHWNFLFGGGGGGVIGDRVFVRLVLFCFDFRISAVVYFYLCMLVYISA